MILRDYQAKGSEVVKSYLKYPHRHPLFAVPTGGGKTLMIADAIRVIKEHDPDAKIIVLSHVQEILEQNAKAISMHLGRLPAVYSSGIGLRQISDITVAGIQSVWRIADSFSSFRYIIIDESHSISREGNSMYQNFFASCHGQRIGYTATPFRLKDGYIYGKGMMFTELAYDLTSADSFVNLVNQGYLCKLITKGTKQKMDTSDIKIVAGDFSDKDMSKKFDKASITKAAIDELLEKASDRKKILIFAIDINHAEHITEELLRRGESANLVHSKMIGDRSEVISKYKSGGFRFLVNVNVLTTGFDDPAIDCIALLRPTQSPVIHIQTIGRGLRVHPDKSSCLILDFAGNISRIGPINDVKIRKPGKGAKGIEPAMKECPKCLDLVFPAVRECPSCGHKFEFKTKLASEADEDANVISEGKKKETEYAVNSVSYQIVKKIGAPNMIKVSYLCGAKIFNEWICLEHTGYAKTKADHWVKYRGGSICNTVEDFMAQKESLKIAKRIKVVYKGAFAVVEVSYF